MTPLLGCYYTTRSNLTKWHNEFPARLLKKSFVITAIYDEITDWSETIFVTSKTTTGMDQIVVECYLRK